MSNKCCTSLYKGTVQNDATLCKERCNFMLGMSYCRQKDLAAQSMYWRVWKQMSKAMLKLVCWLHFQVLTMLYFLPWLEVTFWEGAQTMRKSAKHAHLDDINEMWLSRHGPTAHGPPLVVLFQVLDMLGRSCKASRKPIMLFAHWSSALASTSQNQKKQKQKKT